MTKYLQVDSIGLEAWDEHDKSALPILLPKGAVLEIVKSFTTTLTETGQPATLFWVKFYGSQNTWCVTPEYWQATVRTDKPMGYMEIPPAIAVGNAMYRLVRVDDYGETELRKTKR